MNWVDGAADTPMGRGLDISDVVSFWEGRCLIEWAATWKVQTTNVVHWDVLVHCLMGEVTEPVRCVG